MFFLVTLRFPESVALSPSWDKTPETPPPPRVTAVTGLHQLEGSISTPWARGAGIGSWGGCGDRAAASTVWGVEV